MTLPLTPDMIEAAYEYLRATPPFKWWKLPPGEDVVFHVSAARDYYGQYSDSGGLHTIWISARNVGHTHTLLRTTSHEIIHLKQVLNGDKRAPLPHNSEFRRMASLVAKYHGFDPKEL